MVGISIAGYRKGYKSNYWRSFKKASEWQEEVITKLCG
jgi:hypothetical protein